MKKLLAILLMIIGCAFGFFRWAVPVDISASGMGNTVVFGADSAATEAYEPMLDIPFFPSPGAYGYFPLDDTLHPAYTMLGTDYRAPSQDTIVWDFMLAGGFGFNLEWEISNLPDSGEYAIGPYVVDSLPVYIVLDWIDMRSLDSIGINMIGGRIRVTNAPVSTVDEFAALPENNEIAIWPNPCNSSCKIALSENSREAIIFDMSGREVSRVQSENGIAIWNATNINSENMPSGVYYIKSDIGGISAGKVVIIR